MVALCLCLGCCILLVNIRPSLAMPIEGDFFQHGRRDYQTTSPHQRLQEQHSKLGNVRDKVPSSKKFKYHKASKKSSKKSARSSLTKFNTIQIKLPNKLSTPNSATLPQSSSLDDDTATEGLTSASGSGSEFPSDLTDADGFEEPEDFSVSGSGYDNGYLNPGLIGGTSDIAFMLADAKNRPPAFPAPGLPMNLTRQQAIDIYKSAMYFAGLMGAETTGSDNSTSKDEGEVAQKQPSESQEKVNSSSLEESTNRTEGNQSQDGKSEAPQESATSLQTPPSAVSATDHFSNDNQGITEPDDDDDDTPPPDETLMKAAQANYAADQQAEKAMYFMSHTRQSGGYSSSSKRAIICKGTTQKISCSPDKRLRILNADYGDTGNAGCLKETNPEPSGPCRTPGAFEIVKRECDGYEDCALPASNEVFGDACPDANKYLDVNYDCVNNAVAPAPAAYSPAPPPASYGGLPDLLPPSPYVAPNPCNPCNTCAQCALPVCSPCGSTCQILTCGPRIPAKLQPLWQQFNERTADMSRMEMAALIISPLPKLAPTKAPESSGAAEGSESGEPTLDEDALYEASKKSKIQRIKPHKASRKTSLTAAKKKPGKNSDNEQGFLRNTDSVTSSGDASSGGSST
ncbi:Latrophilin Cirl [Acropora cervicornis]|uniref:Latrophilin Cirl n=1 Tax=Acropora cervicornis TaxID=6130 RepID=A0AAD9R018_ACRCE|nr:Latrophilin Cirl [Acropora cervicornis]